MENDRINQLQELAKRLKIRNASKLLQGKRTYSVTGALFRKCVLFRKRRFDPEIYSVNGRRFSVFRKCALGAAETAENLGFRGLRSEV